ncbi:GNAT family N-acetyltransferase [Amycolatopsis sp. FU40]|uniref:GNAT family N-acetyltransferase n=1 Tax=Amycolatopsis sp. FU40 TaxID=2914159 RepID=UPI001F4279A3|nr:GNAT family N-acetyltransferase [Amycolatopsis sp. FU40]UKD51481.1 GNAT family N-acetyltransferase [Amycolatopsis sp. FU40]
MDLETLPGATLLPATPDDAAELMVLQRCCWVQEALLNNTLAHPALREDLAEVREAITTWRSWVVRQGHRLVGAVRARSVEDGGWEIGRLMVAPDLAGRGLGRLLLEHAERHAPPETKQFVLFTGAASERNIALYERAGYRRAPMPFEATGIYRLAVYLVKPA